jgi:hypothetical protein
MSATEMVKAGAVMPVIVAAEHVTVVAAVAQLRLFGSVPGTVNV